MSAGLPKTHRGPTQPPGLSQQMENPFLNPSRNSLPLCCSRVQFPPRNEFVFSRALLSTRVLWGCLRCHGHPCLQSAAPRISSVAGPPSCLRCGRTQEAGDSQGPVPACCLFFFPPAKGRPTHAQGKIGSSWPIPFGCAGKLRLGSEQQGCEARTGQPKPWPGQLCLSFTCGTLHSPPAPGPQLVPSFLESVDWRCLP